MKLVQDSAEHHFLTALAQMNDAPAGWVMAHFALSQGLAHDDVIAVPAHIPGKLHKHKKHAGDFAAALMKDAERIAATLRGAAVYVFADGDVAALLPCAGADELQAAQDVFAAAQARADKAEARFLHLARDMYAAQKLAAEKLLSARRMHCYGVMADAGRVQSIPLRRDLRREGAVLLVEDDRFTAAFAANMLNRDYDFVHAKTGEEAIESYIEYAPDIVLLDIHLPGLSGLDTLRAIRAVDPRAAVIVLSIDTIKANIVTAQDNGALGFLKKPFSKERLLAAIARSPHLSGAKRRI